MTLNQRIFNKRILNATVLPTIGAAVFATVLAGCQATTKHTTAKPVTDTVKTTIPVQMLATGKSSLSCSGTYACEITTIGKLPVISQTTHMPNPSLSQHSEVNVTALPKTNSQNQFNIPNYLVTFPSGQQLVATKFYLDDGLNTVENFSFIHEFNSGKRYQLKAYRQIQKTDYSLLAQSAPTPLCLDLLEDNKLTNRWCKKPNQQGALSNEFIKVAF